MSDSSVSGTERHAPFAAASWPPRVDFSVHLSARCRSGDPLFAEISTVTLAGVIPVTFLRPVVRSMTPEDVAAMLYSSYAAIPSDSLAGRTDVISVRNGERAARTSIFHITNEEFGVFRGEVAAASLRTPRQAGWTTISRLRDCRFARFLLERVVDSPVFLSDDRRRLLG